MNTMKAEYKTDIARLAEDAWKAGRRTIVELTTKEASSMITRITYIDPDEQAAASTGRPSKPGAPPYRGPGPRVRYTGS